MCTYTIAYQGNLHITSFLLLFHLLLLQAFLSMAPKLRIREPSAVAETSSGVGGGVGARGTRGHGRGGR